MTQPNVPPVFPRLEVQRIAACPECFGDCIDEGTDLWCPRCRASWTFAQVGYFEDVDRDD